MIVNATPGVGGLLRRVHFVSKHWIFPAHAPNRVNCAQPLAGEGRQARPARATAPKRGDAPPHPCGDRFCSGGEKNRATFGGHACKKGSVSRGYSRGRASGVSGEPRKSDSLFPGHQDDLHRAATKRSKYDGCAGLPGTFRTAPRKRPRHRRERGATGACGDLPPRAYNGRRRRLGCKMPPLRRGSR